MQICVCGWYYFPKLMPILKRVHETTEHDVFIVAHRENAWLEEFDHYIRENKGVEYGAYDWFLKNQWDRESPVFLMHDDVNILPIMRNYEIVSPLGVFNSISEIEYDLAYVFKNVTDERVNYGVHGRGIFMSPRFIMHLLIYNKGLWWDKNNDGHIAGPTPEHCHHFNEADYRFRTFWRDMQEKGIDMKVGMPVYIPAFDAAYRGREGEQEEGKGVCGKDDPFETMARLNRFYR